jgi:hypothetical protein
VMSRALRESIEYKAGNMTTRDQRSHAECEDSSRIVDSRWSYVRQRPNKCIISWIEYKRLVLGIPTQ